MPAPRSRRLRVADVRRIFGLIGDVRDLHAQPFVQRECMTDGLCGMLGAMDGFSVEFKNFTALDSVDVTSLIIGGHPDPQSLQYFQQWAKRGLLREDPLVDISTGLRGPVAARIQDLVDWQTHQRSGVYAGWYDPARIGDTLVAFYRHHDRSRASGISLHREACDGGFSERDRAAVDLFAGELHRLYLAGHLTSERHTVHLPPRQQQVLQGMLRGEEDRRIAVRLGLSPRTVQEYAQMIYRRFGVEGRFDLLARFVPPSSAHPDGRGDC